MSGRKGRRSAPCEAEILWEAGTEDLEEPQDVEKLPDAGEWAEVCTFIVQEKDRGRRVDAWLPEQREGLTRSAAARLCEAGRVRRDGRPLPKNARLAGGETVTAAFPEPEPMEAVPQDIPLDIVYEDADVIVVNKPAGLVVHPAPGHPDGTLVNALLYHCGGFGGTGGRGNRTDSGSGAAGEGGGGGGKGGRGDGGEGDNGRDGSAGGMGGLSGIGGILRPGIVHRIDRDTSGLLIAAKNDAAHLSLSAQLKDHTLARTYRCIVVGNLREDAGTVDAPIGRSGKDRKRMAVYSGAVISAPARGGGNPSVLPAGVRSAVTHWRVIERLRGHTDVECRLETGRTHQIRVHMAHIGHPVLGDPVYGKAVPGLTGQCLHAVGLRFLHPRTGEPVELHCDLPMEYVEQLRKLRG